MGDLIFKLNTWHNLVGMHKCVHMPGKLVKHTKANQNA